MNPNIIIRLTIFAVGALLLVVGDYLYGTTYYTNIATLNPERFLISGLLGMIAACCYLYGLFGYANGFKDPKSLLRKTTIAGLSLFTVGVATTHSLASADMFVLNQSLVETDAFTLTSVLNEIENAYNFYFIPTVIGLIIGFISLFIGVIREQTIFSKKALIFFPLTLALVITTLDSLIPNYPLKTT